MPNLGRLPKSRAGNHGLNQKYKTVNPMASNESKTTDNSQLLNTRDIRSNHATELCRKCN